MRIRSTRPDFWRSKRIASVSWEARLVLKGLESYVDDNGVGKDDLALIASDVFPRDLAHEPSGTLRRLQTAIDALHQAGLVHRYTADGTELLYISFWEQVQYIQRPGAGRLPRPDGTLDYGESEIREPPQNPPEPSGACTEPSIPKKGSRGVGEKGRRGTTSSTADAADQTDRDFDAFWDIYPRKAAKRKAAAAYRNAVKRATPETILAGAELYRDDPNRDDTYTKLPTTWLNGDCWHDPPLPPRSGQPRDRQAEILRREHEWAVQADAAEQNQLHLIEGKSR